MKRRIFAAALACALILLSACGGGSGSSSTSSSSSGSPSSSSASGSSSSSDSSQGGLLLPDSSNPDANEVPDASLPDGSAGEVDEPVAESSLSLSKNDFTLFKTGATWQLKAKAEPAGGAQSWASSDEKVATVDEKGVVTAVGEGSATITVTDENTGLSASCIVRVRVEEEKPDNGGSSSSSGSSSSGSGSSSSGSQSSNVDLTAFADQMMADYEFSHLQLADASLMDSLYSGLSGVSTEQCLVYCTMMTMNNGEFVLVQVKDSKDVDTVKGILQARINYMAGDGENPGGAWYPGPTEQWKNNSRVVSNGNYVMMVVHENCDDIVTAFNNLF